MQTFISLALAILMAVTGQFLIKKGVTGLGPLDLSFKNAFFLFKQIFKNIYIFIGLVSYGLSFIAWLFVLSRMKLSVAYPATSTIYVLIILASWLFLKETITLTQIIGILIILTGLFFLFRG